jgi:phage shock protein PspC (stress-responsive transcriptional regulator)
MKRLITTHLDGRIFQIDEDGYEILNNVLANQMKRREVEKQFADLFEHKLTDSKNVITCVDVADICYRLGFSISTAPRVKKLYRQPKDSIIAGVCTGLGEYFDIDAVVLRIAFVASFFLAFIGFWIYIAIWIVTPKYEKHR